MANLIQINTHELERAQSGKNDFEASPDVCSDIRDSY